MWTPVKIGRLSWRLAAKANQSTAEIKEIRFRLKIDDHDFEVKKGNYSWAADLKPADALAMEKQDGGVIEVFVVRTQDVDSPKKSLQ